MNFIYINYKKNSDFFFFRKKKLQTFWVRAIFIIIKQLLLARMLYSITGYGTVYYFLKQ